MNRLVAASLAAFLTTSAALAQSSPPTSTQLLTNVPRQSVTVTDWYKQNVFDPSNHKIGEVKDVLVSQDGRVSALIVGVGGLLGIGEKDVAVAFDAIKHTTRDNKVYLTMDTTNDALKAAAGFRYDPSTTTWVPDTGSSKPATTQK
jgi:hypothetical protein